MYSLKILQNTSKDVFNTMAITFPNKTYLFNCCEGTQKNAMYQGISFKKINEVFFSSTEISSYSGVFGFIMSRSEQIIETIEVDDKKKSNNKKKETEDSNNNLALKENNEKIIPNQMSKEKIEDENNIRARYQFSDKKRLFLYGSKGLSSRFYDCSGFLNKRILNDINEFCKSRNGFYNCNTYNDTDTSVNKIDVNPQNKSKSASEFQDENLTIFTICSKNSDNNSQFSLQYKESIDSLSYFLIPFQQPATFLESKAKELGLKPGPNYGKLKNGQTVQTPEGKTITPDMVLADQSPSQAIAYIYSPTINHALNLISQIKSEKRFNISNSKISTNKYYFNLVIHLIGDINILKLEEYQEFIKSFSKDTIHVFDCQESNWRCMINEKSWNQKYILNLISENLFTKVHYNYDELKPNVDLISAFESFKDYKFVENEKTDNYINTSNDSNVIRYILSKPGVELIFTSKTTKISALTIYDHPFYYDSSTFMKFKTEHQHIFDKINKITADKYKDIEKKQYNNKPEITFLGTISMKPGLQKNVSCIMLSLKSITNKNKTHNILMDCGEGSYQQIFLHFGLNKTKEIISDLSCIFITHKHGDHMLGLPKILEAYDELETKDNKLFIICPKSVIYWVYNLVFDLKCKNNIIIVNCEHINPRMTKVYDYHVRQKNPYLNFNDVEIKSNFEELSKSISDYKNELVSQFKVEESCCEDKLTEYKDKDQNMINIKTNSSIKNIKESDIAKVKNLYEFLKDELNIEIFSIEVFHCNDSYGCLIQSCNYLNQNSIINKEELNPWKITYSGDTRPCNNFINYSLNATAIIHEATLDDELAQDAKEKLHSTFSEACEVRNKSLSDKVILTHFSPRYLKECPWLERFAVEKVLVANDYLNVQLSDLVWAYNYGKEANRIMNEFKNDDKL